MSADDENGDAQRKCRNQKIAAGAMNDRKNLLAKAPFFPKRIKR